MEKEFVFRKDTQNILKKYAFDINGVMKIFCPNCFCLNKEVTMRKHFGKCSFRLEGEKIFEEGRIRIIKAHNDFNLRRFIGRLQKYIWLDGSTIRRMRYNKNHDYWVLQIESKNWGILPIGFAAVKYSSMTDCHVLFVMIIFPEVSRNRGFGTTFTEELVKHYKKDYGLIVESPSNITKKICDKFGLTYYDAP